MTGIRSFVFILLLSGCPAPVSAAGVTPIQKVIDMMNDMVTKGRKEKEDEATKFSAFDQWCQTQKRIKTNEVKKGNDELEKLDAHIEQAQVRISQLDARIKELQEDVGRWALDSKNTRDVRGKEKLDYQATAQDYSESIDAIAGAMEVLKKQAYSRAQAESLIQVQKLKLLPVEAKSALAAFLQQGKEDPEYGSTARQEEGHDQDRLYHEAPEAHGYEFQSGGVIEMLEKLKDEFRTKKQDLDREELEAQHAFDQISQLLADSTENANHEIEGKTAQMGKTKEELAQHQADHAATTKERDEDQNYHDETDKLCKQKATDFAARQKLRAEELEAVKKAIDIISSQAVKGTGEDRLPQLLQVQRKTALAQLRANARGPVQDKLAAFIAERAQSLKSNLLSMVSQHVSSDPFDKVKKLIHDLIIKLQEEATAETEHKGWCDAELGQNKIVRESKSDELEELRNDEESLNAEIAQLGKDLATLSHEIQALNKAMSEAEQERRDSNAANTQAIEEAQSAQSAVTQAIAVLKDFYAKSSQATAFTQQSPADDAPETFDKAYTGMLPEGGNIVDFLEVILSDFARLESETSADEAAELQSHKDFMFESKKSKALKENDTKHKTDRKTSKESELQTTKEQIETVSHQLEKANKYFEKLKPPCVSSGINYEDRKAQREAEMASLEEALNILKGTDI